MFFAEIDWVRVALTTLIGGFIGAVFGLVISFFRKPPTTKRDEPSD